MLFVYAIVFHVCVCLFAMALPHLSSSSLAGVLELALPSAALNFSSILRICHTSTGCHPGCVSLAISQAARLQHANAGVCVCECVCVCENPMETFQTILYNFCQQLASTVNIIGQKIQFYIIHRKSKSITVALQNNTRT